MMLVGGSSQAGGRRRTSTKKKGSALPSPQKAKRFAHLARAKRSASSPHNTGKQEEGSSQEERFLG
jgi:hypothetical protein